MKRREFIRKTGKALTLAVVTAATGLYFHNRRTTKLIRPVLKTRDFQVPADKIYPTTVLVRNEDHAMALKQAIDAIGGIKRFIRPGERVTIKPNIGWDRTPAQAANTNPVLVGEMVRLCFAAGASEVVVTDISCNEPRRCFIRSGIKEESEKAGATVVLPAEQDFLQVNLQGKVLTVWPVLKRFVQTDRLINMPITKHHSLCSCTIGMKNFYGILGGRRNRLHQEIDQSIVDLAGFCRPTLTVVDATRVLMRSGPQGGSLDDVSVQNTVICSTDQVAADSRAVDFLGLKPENVGHIVLAEKSGLGKLNYRSAGYREIS